MLVIFGIILAYLYSIIGLPVSSGIYPKINPTIKPFINKGSVIIPYSKKKAIHIHHWVIYLCIIIFSLFIPIPKILIGFSLGLILQGLTYNDRFDFICENPYK